MSKIAIITDTHFGARSDSLQMQQSMGKFFNNIFFPTIDEYGVDFILHGGDYVDKRKYFNFSTGNFVNKTYREPLRQRGIHEVVLVGNHDCFYRHSTEINAIEELHRLDERVEVVSNPCMYQIDGEPFLLLPWICDSNRDRSMQLIQDAPIESVVLGHLEIAGFSMYRGIPNAEGLDPSIFDRFQLVMSGHFHHRSEKDPIHYLGAPYPMIWSDYADKRGFHIFDTKTRELTFIENPYSLFAKFYYDDAGRDKDWLRLVVHEITKPTSIYRDSYVKVIVKSKENPFWFDMVLDALNKVNAQEIMLIDDIVVDDPDDENVQTTDIDTIQLVRDYIDSLTINCDKNELDKYMQELYSKAVANSQSGRL